jgi:hypothetical protein
MNFVDEGYSSGIALQTVIMNCINPDPNQYTPYPKVLHTKIMGFNEASNLMICPYSFV